MKNLVSFILFPLVALVCIIDILNLFNNILYIISGLIISFFAFHCGTHRYKLPGGKWLALFFVNIIFLIFTIRYKIYLINILLLGLLVFSILTPYLVRFRRVPVIMSTTAFLAVYLFSINNIIFPVLPLILYPIYYSGYVLGPDQAKPLKRNIFTFLLNIAFSSVLVAVLFYRVRGYCLIEGILFSKYYTPVPKTGIYMPLIAFLYYWLSLNINIFLYALIGRFSGSSTQEPTEYSYVEAFKSFSSNLIYIFFILGSIYFSCEFIIRGELIPTVKAVLFPQAVYNFFVLSTLFLVLTAFLGKGLSTLILTVVAAFLAFANFIKIKFFDEPFYPWDIYLMKNAFMISKNYINLGIVIIILLVIAALVFTAIRFRSKIMTLLKPAGTLSILPLAILLVIINFIVLNDIKLLSGLNISKSWYVGKEEIQANGFFVQNFLYLSDIKKYLFSKPSEYSFQKMQDIDKSLKTGSESGVNNERRPNVIIIMSESFWNPTELEDIKFSRDIVPNLKKYQKGELLSPVIGGATANTEFEALTGLSMYFLGPGTIPYNVYLRRDTPSLATVFKDNGYRTIAMHPNTGDFYNRAKVYNYFGFDSFLDVNSFDKYNDVKGPHISDDKLVDKVLTTLAADDRPKFIFAVTMQNHDPYYNVYSDLEVHAESDKLDETEISIMSNYAQGIYDADKSLGKLISSLEKSGTPALVYYFGDHLPRLGTMQNMYDIYKKLNYSSADNILKDEKLYRTPLAAWSNYADIKPYKTAISPAQIAYDILATSRVKYPAYFNILSKLRNTNPYLHQNFKDRVDVNDPLINDYSLIQYDILFGNQYISKLRSE